MTDIELEQKNLCRIYDAKYYPSLSFQKLGISNDMESDIFPVNGLRHIPHGDTCGWYIWAGEEMHQGQDYFKPVHLFHLYSLFPNLLKFLGLPPGWRFLVAPGYEDVWYDESLLVK